MSHPEAAAPKVPGRDAPFVAQRLDFSCGAASLLMAMATFDDGLARDFAAEIDIWREATIGVVPATTRHGLAYAAWRRGFAARSISALTTFAFREHIVARAPVFFPVTEADKLWVDQRDRCAQAGIPEEARAPTLDDLDAALAAGEIVIPLTNTRVLGDTEDIPHWVVVTGAADGRYNVLNPLDELPTHVQLDRATMAELISGFAGEAEFVIVGPRRRMPGA